MKLERQLILGSLFAAPLAALACGSSGSDGGSGVSTTTMLGDGGAATADSGVNPSGDGGSHDDAGNAADGGGVVATGWLAHRIQSPIPYSAPEYVEPYLNTFCEPQIVSGSRVLFFAQYDDGAAELVVQGVDGSNRTILFSTTTTPGMTVQAFFYVPESNVALALLVPSTSTFSPTQLLAMPLDGSKATMIDSGVRLAQISADGTRVNYVKGGAAAGDADQVMTSPIASPAPSLLGTLDPGYTGGFSDNAIVRSKSAATNVPFFYFVAGQSPNDGPYIARAFGTKPTGAPASITGFTVAQRIFDEIDASANGRFVFFSEQVLADTQLGTQTSESVTFSPDHTAFLTGGANTLTLNRQDGTSQVFSTTGYGSGVWSADSKWIAVIGSGTTNCPITLIDVANGTTSMKSSATCATAHGRVLGFTGDDLSLVSMSGTSTAAPYQLSVTSLTTGVDHLLSASYAYGWADEGETRIAPTSVAGIADTGDGLIYPDGWGLWYAHYDGTGAVRLDTPRAIEPALTSQSIRDYVGGTTGPIGWDPASRTAIFEPVLQGNQAESWQEAIHSLVAVPVAGGTNVQLTSGNKMTGQIHGFEENFHVDDTYKKVLFNSYNGALGSSIAPAILSVGDLAGGNATRLSIDPVADAGATYGGGTMYSAGRLFGDGKTATGAYYRWFELAEDDTDVQMIDGSGLHTYGSYQPRAASPDGTKLIVNDDSESAYVIALPGTPSSTPTPIASGVKLASSSVCFGCSSTTAWTYTDGAVSFTASSQVLLNGQLTSSGATSTFLVDLDGDAGAPIDLGVKNAQIFSDGLTAVATDTASGALETFSVTNPSQKKSFGKLTLVGAAGDGSYLLTSSTGKDLTSIRTSDGTVASLLPTSLPTGGTVDTAPTVLADGKHVSFRYDGSSGQPTDACGGYFYDWVIVGIDGSSPLVVTENATCSISSAQVFPSGSAIAYLDSSAHALFATSGGAPTALSASNERVQAFWVDPTTDIVIVQALTAETTWTFYSIHADGSSRTAFAEDLPIQKRLLDLQFHANGAMVTLDIDPVTDGVLELFDFPVK